MLVASGQDRDILKNNVRTYAPLLYLNALKKLQNSKNPKLRNYKQITTDLLKNNSIIESPNDHPLIHLSKKSIYR